MDEKLLFLDHHVNLIDYKPWHKDKYIYGKLYAPGGF